jgi:hypothetical protein
MHKLYEQANKISIQIFSNENEYFLLPPLKFYHIFSKVKPAFSFFSRKNILFFKPYFLDFFYFLFLFLQNWQTYFSFYSFFQKLFFFLQKKKIFSRNEHIFYNIFLDSNFINLFELNFRVFSFLHLNNNFFVIFFKK